MKDVHILRGLAKKVHKWGQGERVTSAKSGRPLKKIIPCFSKYTQSDNLQTRCLLMLLQLDLCNSSSRFGPSQRC